VFKERKANHIEGFRRISGEVQGNDVECQKWPHFFNCKIRPPLVILSMTD
jgi:hypothetical protein